MGIEIVEKSKETRVKQASMLNTQKSLFGLNGYGRKQGKKTVQLLHKLGADKY